jgi:hypothetical protein
MHTVEAIIYTWVGLRTATLGFLPYFQIGGLAIHFVFLNASLKLLCMKFPASLMLEELKINHTHTTGCVINNETICILLIITTALP